jgi:hypothetical protein
LAAVIPNLAFLEYEIPTELTPIAAYFHGGEFAVSTAPGLSPRPPATMPSSGTSM